MSKTKWTIKNIPSLKGKTAIVTGGNSGLGLEAVKALAAKGARVIMACRSLKKAEATRDQLIETLPKAEIIIMELDLADLNSVRNFAAKYKQNHSKLDILINNAGIMMVPYGLTRDGFELQIGTNHLGHFALTGLLLDVIKHTPGARVINITSLAHKSGKMDFDNLMCSNGKGYSSMKAYGRSKLANLLFTYELQRFFKANSIDAMALAAHPGFSDTHLFHSVVADWALALFKPVTLLLAQPAWVGAEPGLRAATDPEAKGGEFYGPSGHFEVKGHPVRVQSNEASHNQEDAENLWAISEKLTGVKFELFSPEA